MKKILYTVIIATIASSSCKVSQPVQAKKEETKTEADIKTEERIKTLSAKKPTLKRIESGGAKPKRTEPIASETVEPAVLKKEHKVAAPKLKSAPSPTN